MKFPRRVLGRGAAIAAAAALLADVALRADTTVPVPTDLGSGITIRLTTPVAAMARFGFLPLRVNVENTTDRDGRWTLRFQAGMLGVFPGELTSDFEVAVPAGQTRGQWIYVPLAEPGVTLPTVPVLGSSPRPSIMGSPASSPGPAISMPTLPTTLPGVLPPPKGVIQAVEPSPLRTSPSGALSRTYVIKQTGPAGLLPEMAPAQLPASAQQRRTVDPASGEVTRITTLLVEAAPSFPPSGSIAYSGSSSGTARDLLETAGLLVKQPGIRQSTSAKLETNRISGVREMVTTIAQTGPAATLPPVASTALPTGVTTEHATTATPGEVTRTFVVREPVPNLPSGGTLSLGSSGTGSMSFSSGNITSGGTILSSSGSSYYSSGSSSAFAAAETAARAKLAGTGLLTVTPGVKESRMLLTLPTISGTPVAPGSGPAVLWIQTGPAALLRRPTTALPPGTIVVLHPAATPGDVVRTVSYLDPAAGAASAGGPPAGYPPSLYVQMTSRFDLQRYGYLRADGAVQQSQSIRNSPTLGGGPGVMPGAPPTAVIFSESGPANLLPQPDPKDLPPGVTVSVTPGALPGETQRNFIVGGSGLSGGSPSLAPAGSRGSSPITRTRSFGSQPPVSISATVSGPGLGKPAEVLLTGILGGTLVTPPLAVAAGVEPQLRSRLATAGVRGAPNLAPIEIATLPADWRVWSSFHSVILPATEYDDLDVARRAALLRWVALGGRLLLVPAAAGPAESTWPGAGRIDRLAGPVDEIVPAALLTALRLDEPPLSLPDPGALTFAPKSALGAIITGVDEANTWLALFLVVFAIVIGPVNLFFLAPAARRHRLFFTTPLLALVGAGVLAATIVLRDGFGGDGARRTLVVLMPEDHVAAVFQEDAVATGFLRSPEFPLADDVLIVPLRGRAGTALFQRPPAGMTFGGLTRRADRAGGAWFRNRWRQAHHVRALVPTRMRVEVTVAMGRPPIAESTLGTTLRDFVFADAEGKLWAAAELPPGRRVALEPTTRWPAIITGGTPCLDSIAKSAIARTPGRWTARGGPTEVAPVPLLAGLRWTDDETRYTGMATLTAAAAKGGGQ